LFSYVRSEFTNQVNLVGKFRSNIRKQQKLTATTSSTTNF
jgi:hypothetical protein